jgi:hypothetical protein
MATAFAVALKLKNSPDAWLLHDIHSLEVFEVKAKNRLLKRKELYK